MLLVVGLLVAGVLVAGCGDDENSGSGGGDTAAQTDTGGGGSESAPPETTTEESGGGASTPQAKQAAEACKQQIETQPGISEDVRADLEKICEKAASGDEKEVREATKEVCIKLIEENVPEGPGREQALAACDQSTATP